MTDVKNTKEQISIYKEIIKGKKFTAGYRESCKTELKRLESLSMTTEEAIEIINRVFHYYQSEIFTKEQKEGIVNCLQRVEKSKGIIESIEVNLKDVMKGCSVNAEDMLSTIRNLKKGEE